MGSPTSPLESVSIRLPQLFLLPPTAGQIFLGSAQLVALSLSDVPFSYLSVIFFTLSFHDQTVSPVKEAFFNILPDFALCNEEFRLGLLSLSVLSFGEILLFSFIRSSCILFPAHRVTFFFFSCPKMRP